MFRKETVNEDVKACDKKLGKEPPLPDEKNSIAISKNVAERLQTGTIKDHRLENYDNYWMDKIACIDESHTLRSNLDINEAEQALERVTKYVKSSKPKITSDEQIELEKCFERSRGDTLQCNKNVDEFIQHVDRLLYEAVRKDNEGTRSEKKMSYAEKFQRGYSF